MESDQNSYVDQYHSSTSIMFPYHQILIWIQIGNLLSCQLQLDQYSLFDTLSPNRNASLCVCTEMLNSVDFLCCVDL